MHDCVYMYCYLNTSRRCRSVLQIWSIMYMSHVFMFVLCSSVRVCYSKSFWCGISFMWHLWCKRFRLTFQHYDTRCQWNIRFFLNNKLILTARNLDSINSTGFHININIVLKKKWSLSSSHTCVNTNQTAHNSIRCSGITLNIHYFYHWLKHWSKKLFDKYLNAW